MNPGWGDLPVDSLFDLGNKFYDERKYGEAAAVFGTLADRDVDVGPNLGNALRELGDLSAALEAFVSAISRGDSQSYRNAGLVLEELDRPLEAVGMYEGAFEHAGDTEALTQAAFVLHEQSTMEERAIELMRQAARHGSALATAALAVWMWDRTQDESYEHDLRQGMACYPSARAALAMLMAARGDVDDAIELLQKGLALGEVESSVPLGNLLWNSRGDLLAAADAYRFGADRGDSHARENLQLVAAVMVQQGPADRRHGTALGRTRPSVDGKSDIDE